MLVKSSDQTHEEHEAHMKQAVSLVIAYGHFHRGLCGYVRVNILTLSAPSISAVKITVKNAHITIWYRSSLQNCCVLLIGPVIL